MGWYRGLSRSIFDAFRRRRCSSKNTLQGYWLSTFYNTSNNNVNYSLTRYFLPFRSIIRSSPFLVGGVNRFYSVSRYIKEKRVLVGSGAVVSLYSWLLGSLKYECSEIVPYTKRSHIVIDYLDDEIKEGEDAFQIQKAILGEKILPPHHPKSIRVQGIAHNIIQALHRGLKQEKPWSTTSSNDHLDLERFKWEIIVADDPTFNATCVPGGKIIVYTGLLDHFTSDAEIATIIGHEVAHAVARHSNEISSKIFMWLILPPFFFVFLMPPFYGGHIVETLWAPLPFERRLEAEADRIGMLLMASAGYDPRVAPKIFEKLGEICGDETLWESYTSTHYSDKKRAQLLSQTKVMKEAMCLYREEQLRQAILLLNQTKVMKELGNVLIQRGTVKTSDFFLNGPH